MASAHLNSDRIGSTFQPPIAGADEAEAGGASGATRSPIGDEKKRRSVMDMICVAGRSNRGGDRPLLMLVDSS